MWEAVYILDGLLKNQLDIQPDTIHADTQGQSEAVFSLAALAALSPYITAHINRLGRYELNARRRVPVLDYTLFARPVPARLPRTPVAAVALTEACLRQPFGFRPETTLV